MLERGERIGEIVRLQVQKVPLKEKGVGYSPAALLPVDVAAVDAWGMLGWDHDQWVVDTHNKAHPSRRGGGRRQLSVGFTGHYAEMERRFGNVPIGVAGENFIVEGPPYRLEDLGEGFVIEAADGDLALERPRIAAACVEFTSFMLDLDHVAALDDVREDYDALQEGRRGFIVAADHASEAVEVRVGDVMYFGRSQ